MRKVSVIFVLLLGLLLPAIQIEAAGNSQFIIINKRTNTLAFYDGGHLVRTFKVATGKTRDLTPEGKFRIVNKIVNRPYYKEHIAGGDPRNPLGNRWMGLEARGTYGTTYGIHGNNNENSIGKYVSHGCVRMHNEEVRWLFDQVQKFTTVVITYSNSSFDEIAQANGYGVSIPASGGIDNENPAPLNGWVVTNGKTYYYANGTAKTGWQTVNGKSYFFDNNGIMKTGWLSLGSKTYYLDGKGVRQTGW
ncbi:L,D-transpeptidase family protein, partial [Neobacillus drentensis]|uniref:L,D-transpeptidase family protein n=1 Tax=Neobacillus drentensis TaxID=220684 RepID=UPI00300336A0